MTAADSTASPPEKMLAEWFWTDRWTGSSAFLLPQEARGVYREMLTQAWQRGAKLPNDHEAIRRATGTTAAEWRRSWPMIEKYWRVDGDSLVNDTQRAVYAEAQALRERYSTRAKKGAQARWKQSSRNASRNAQAKPEDMPEQCTPSPSPSLTQNTDQPSADPPERKERAPIARADPTRRGFSPGPLAGALPRDHAYCHQPCIRVCVSERQHAILRSKFGGDPVVADKALDEFYAEVRGRLSEDQPIGDRSWDFWDKQFAARFGGVSAVGKTAGNAAAAARFIARGGGQ